MIQVPYFKRQLVNVPKSLATFVLLIIMVLYIGTLPVSWSSINDRMIYATQFIDIQKGLNESWGKDWIFTLYIMIASRFCNYQIWFILTAFIYCFNYYLLSNRISKKHSYILLLMFFTSFTFYSYGVNTIRAGFAASFLILALTYYDKIIPFVICLFVAIGCHFSMAIPAIAILISKYFNKTKLYFYIWLLSIVLSALLGSYFESVFAMFTTDKRAGYLLTSADDTIYNVGFRIDFILYSCLPIFMGYYYIVKKKYKNELYSLLLNTYIIANSFWILVIRANYSDRFAYLSWFLYPVLLIYPLLKVRIWRRQYKKITMIVLLHEMFTYIMFLR